VHQVHPKMTDFT